MKYRNMIIGIGLFAAESAQVYAEESKVKYYSIPSSNGVPVAISSDVSGRIWLVDFRNNLIFIFNPKDEQFTKYEIPTSRSSATDKTVDKSFREYHIPTPMSQPTGIVATQKGAVWFIESQGNKLGKLTPETGKIKEYVIPKPFCVPTELTVDGQGELWFSARKDRKLVKFDTRPERFEEFELPGKGVPEGLAVDSAGNIWYCDKDKKRVGRYSPKDKGFIEIDFDV